MNKDLIIPVILCGGSGTRLWPLSRESFPKQYLSLSSNNEKTLLQNTYERVKDINGICNPILICNEEHRFIAAEQMREINVKPLSILLEPFGRNTAPAIALAALIALEKAENPTLLILSSDHEIKEKEKFVTALKDGINYANADKIVTFGVLPTHPETGYGYIKAKNPINKKSINAYEISEFTEKPTYKKAKEFILDKRYTWNSGMFVFKAQNIIEEIKNFSPEIVKFCKNSLNESEIDLDFCRLDTESFSKCSDISIDVAVMEKTNKGLVIPLDAGWSDIGSWQSIWETSNKNESQNVTKGKVVLEDSNNCLVKGENNRLIVGVGLSNLVVVDTTDALLIAEMGQSQKVKKIVKNLKEQKFPESYQHKKTYRPWGYYTSVVEDSRWQVKLINVKPSEQLSLQMHHYRSEHWIVVKGTAKVEVDNKIELLAENQSTYIPLGSKHRLSNPGKIPLVLIEVQSGSYVGEDDIVRFEDKYGRLE